MLSNLNYSSSRQLCGTPKTLNYIFILIIIFLLSIPINYAFLDSNISSNEDQRCLNCIRNVSSQLAGSEAISKRCEAYYCGPFQLSYTYWAEAGKPGNNHNAKDFEKCAKDRSCSEQTVRAYFKKFKRDCNSDGKIDCLDMAALHKAGPNSCSADWFYKSKYWLAFSNRTDCSGPQTSMQNGNDRWPTDGYDPGQRQSSNRQQAIRNQSLTNDCLECICDAVSGCNTSVNNCGSSAVCGPFAISSAYWKEGQKPGASWTACARTKECSSITIKNYMEKFKRDCNNDGVITCEDYAAIHRRGPRACTNRDLFKDHYWNKFLACRANQLPSRDVNTVKVHENMPADELQVTTSPPATGRVNDLTTIIMTTSTPPQTTTQSTTTTTTTTTITQRPEQSHLGIFENNINRILHPRPPMTLPQLPLLTLKTQQVLVNAAPLPTADLPPSQMTTPSILFEQMASRRQQQLAPSDPPALYPPTRFESNPANPSVSNRQVTKPLREEESELPIQEYPLIASAGSGTPIPTVDEHEKVIIDIVGNPAFANSHPPLPPVVEVEPMNPAGSNEPEKQQIKQTQQTVNTNHSKPSSQISNRINSSKEKTSIQQKAAQQQTTTWLASDPNIGEDSSKPSSPSLLDKNLNFNESYSRIASECLECICDASSNCDTSVQCISKQRDKNRCGLYMISWNQYQESDISLATLVPPNQAGLTEEMVDEKLYYECTTDRACAEKLIHLYIEKHQKDCNNDGKIDCYDIAAIHRVGPDNCNSSKFLSTHYWKDFNNCYDAERLSTTPHDRR